MKKSLKVTLIIIGVLVGIIMLDTLQAKIFNNSPIIKIRKDLKDGYVKYIDKGLFVNHYYCTNNEEKSVFIGTNYTCSISDDIVKDFDFYITKPEIHHNIRFNDYFTFSDRKIYLAGNVNQFYVVDGKTMLLKEYISNANRTMDDSIKSITDKLELKDILKDGGTKIYKSKEKDITMIVCNTTKNDKNIFIGDYSMEYTDGDCRN